MKSLFFTLAVVLMGWLPSFAQDTPHTLVYEKPGREIIAPEKMPCGGGTLMITNMVVENQTSGDPSDGASWTWTATGSSTMLYHTQLLGPK